MRRVAVICRSALVAWLVVSALARAEAVYRDAVEGMQTASAERGGVNLLLNAAGDLPGVSLVSLRRDGVNVTGGSWSLTVFPPNADPAAGEKGRLSGTVTGGTLTFNGEGELTKADAVRLNIEGGTGRYAGVRTGGGAINIASNVENPSQLIGTLTLNF